MRQPAQRRRAQRDPDRGTHPRAPRRRRLNPWLWLPIGLGAAVALWLVLVGALFTFGRKEDARDLAAFIPDCVILVKRLLGDPRVPWRAKLVLILAFVYLVIPFDLVPDFIPVAGQLDDAILLAAVLAYVVRLAGREVVEELWTGSERGLRVVLALT
ncbi:MAG: DUF1232 domain-containing protein [Actinobacteria bacterium]|nr:MAG: DUF1232 domain-containing protein [Actinomycetota bacterium]